MIHQESVDSSKKVIHRIDRSKFSAEIDRQRHIVQINTRISVPSCTCEKGLAGYFCLAILIIITQQPIDGLDKLQLLRKFGVIPSLLEKSIIIKTTRSLDNSVDPSDKTVKIELTRKGRAICYNSLTPFQYQSIESIFENWNGKDALEDFFTIISTKLNTCKIRRINRFIDRWSADRSISREEYFEFKRIRSILLDFLHRYGYVESYNDLKLIDQKLAKISIDE
jgi:hypothetical protein